MMATVLHYSKHIPGSNKETISVALVPYLLSYHMALSTSVCPCRYVPGTLYLSVPAQIETAVGRTCRKKSYKYSSINTSLSLLNKICSF